MSIAIVIRCTWVVVAIAGCQANPSAPTGGSGAPVAPAVPKLRWTRVAAPAALEDFRYSADIYPIDTAHPIDHIGREAARVGRDAPGPSFDFTFPEEVRLAVRTIDNDVASIVPIVAGDHDDRQYQIRLAGKVSEVDYVREGRRTERTLGEADDRSFTLSGATGLVADLHVGQHLRGTLAREHEAWVSQASAQLSDDAGVVLEIDPGSVTEAGGTKPYERGHRIARHADDQAFEERSSVSARLPGSTAPIQLDGWTRMTTPVGTYDAFGIALAKKPDTDVMDYFDTLAFSAFRVPTTEASAGQVSPVPDYDPAVGDPVTSIPSSVANLPNEHASIFVVVVAPPGDACKTRGPATRMIDGKVASIGALRPGSKDRRRYIVRVAGTVTEDGKPADPRFEIDAPRGTSVDLAVGRRIHGSISVCSSTTQVELSDDEGVIAALVFAPAATISLGTTGVRIAPVPASARAGGDAGAELDPTELVAVTFSDGTNATLHNWSRWQAGSHEYAVYGTRYVFDPPIVKAHQDSFSFALVRLAGR